MGKSKYTGVTIHSGWYPQLNAGNLSKKFSSKKGGVKIKGYERGFVEQVQSLSNDRRESLQNEEFIKVTTNLQRGAASMDPTAAFMQFVMEGKKRERAVTYKDIVGAEEYKNRSNRFVIRGTHIWYLQGNSGPKAIAKAILNKETSQNPFSFAAAENWYHNNAPIPQQKKQVNWAMNALQLDNRNIKRTVTVDDVEKAQDTAEELVFNSITDTGDKLGMKVTPSTPKHSTAKSRDISSELGEIESTEMQWKKGGHHGMPEGYESLFKKEEGEDEKTQWTNFMTNQVLTTWNDYVRKVVASTKVGNTKPNKKLAAKKISGTTAGMLEGMPNIPLHFIQKIKHEFSIAQIDANGFQKTWKEGIPISGRNEVTGNRTYASTELKFTKGLEFAVKDVQIVRGLNHTLALAVSAKLISSAEARDFYIAQQDHHNHAKSNNIGVATSVNGITSSGYDRAASGVNAKTNVSFSLKDTTKFFEEFTKNVIGKVKDGITDRSRQIQQKLKDKAAVHNDIFWASPYISIEEGLWSK